MNNKNRLYFYLARAFREPTRSDFESNPEIMPEELVDYELGWNYKLEKIQFKTNWYFMSYKNQLVLTQFYLEQKQDLVKRIKHF